MKSFIILIRKKHANENKQPLYIAYFENVTAGKLFKRKQYNIQQV